MYPIAMTVIAILFAWPVFVIYITGGGSTLSLGDIIFLGACVIGGAVLLGAALLADAIGRREG